MYQGRNVKLFWTSSIFSSKHNELTRRIQKSLFMHDSHELRLELDWEVNNMPERKTTYNHNYCIGNWQTE